MQRKWDDEEKPGKRCSRRLYKKAKYGVSGRGVFWHLRGSQLAWNLIQENFHTLYRIFFLSLSPSQLTSYVTWSNSVRTHHRALAWPLWWEKSYSKMISEIPSATCLPSVCILSYHRCIPWCSRLGRNIISQPGQLSAKRIMTSGGTNPFVGGHLRATWYPWAQD